LDLSGGKHTLYLDVYHVYGSANGRMSWFSLKRSVFRQLVNSALGDFNARKGISALLQHRLDAPKKTLGQLAGTIGLKSHTRHLGDLLRKGCSPTVPNGWRITLLFTENSCAPEKQALYCDSPRKMHRQSGFASLRSAVPAARASLGPRTAQKMGWIRAA
jgi:hypothetical protein